ncbi:phage scaffolding protein [[Clostridium] symbiosum]|uniref:phage scaffolding protein n=1 Tax=Clostridium symbiosum TaxID=1512 RepID=UPI001923CA74|nr:phage scaffolding protein [[Clostridium] symbiosum]MDB2032474.1 phage scaffolding protein [[Clostridium] symbiosum]
MKRKNLEDMGLTKEQVDGIMAENGADIEAIKKERDNYKGQLDTAQATLKSFEGVNISELQGKIQTLTTDLANKDTEYQKQLAERDFNDLLKTTAEGYKPRDLKAVMPFLDVEKLKGSKNQEADIKAAIEAVKKDNGYLFQDVSIPRVVAPTPGPGGEKTDDTRTQANNALRSILGRE